nr:programmed cell death protein 2-like [Leptinotarsa decemlineata]
MSPRKQNLRGGAVGRIYSPAATAEIEGNEGEAIIIDTPTYPQHDIPALLQEVTPLPPDICLSNHRRASLIQFASYSLIMNFEVEDNNYCYATSVEHVKELLLEYRENEETVEQTSPDGEGAVGHDFEMYEEGNPAHGDKMGHNFVSKIQANGWPILRYSREFPPLLTRPLTNQPKECQYCRGEVVFEFQILPTIISKLTLITDPIHSARLDFGTVLVYTCVKSCCSPDTTYRIEPLILQKEIS